VQWFPSRAVTWGLSPTEDVAILGGVELPREKNITNFISESHNPDEKIRTGDLFIFIIICFFKL